MMQDNEERTMGHRVGPILDLALPILGVGLVLAAVAFGAGGWGALWLAVLGLLMVEAGVWRLGSRMLHERRYMPLRRELNRFVGLARDLHHRAVAVRDRPGPEAQEQLDEVVATMRASLDRMVAVAACTDDDLGPTVVPDDPPVPAPTRATGT